MREAGFSAESEQEREKMKWDRVLRESSSEGDLKRMREALRMGADPNAHAGLMNKPLILAAERGRLEAVRLLLEAGADVDQVNNEEQKGFGMTPLMMAASEGHLDVMEELVAAGASLEVRTDAGGVTALMWAADIGEVQSVDWLIQKGAEARAYSSVLKKTALDMAIDSNRVECAKRLAQEIDWEAQDEDGGSCGERQQRRMAGGQANEAARAVEGWRIAQKEKELLAKESLGSPDRKSRKASTKTRV